MSFIPWTWGPAYTANSVGTATLRCIAGSSSGQYIIVGGSTNLIAACVFYSTDYGTTWTVSSNPFGGASNITSVASSADGSRMYAIVPGGSSYMVYTSTSYGQFWQNTSTQPSGNSGYTSIACTSTNSLFGNFVVVTTGITDFGQGNVFYSDDFGNSWNADTRTGMNFRSCSINASGVINVVASNSNIGPDSGIYYTTTSTYANNGYNSLTMVNGSVAANWTGVSSSSLTNYVAACNSDSPGKIYVSSDGGSNSGVSEVPIVSGFSGSFRSVSMGVGKCISAITTANTIYYTNDYTKKPLTLYSSPCTSTNLLYLCPSTFSVNGSGSLTQNFQFICGGTVAGGGSALFTAGITPCFKEGSLILCLVDGKYTYIPVETIVPGTIVKTYKHGDKKVEYIGSSKAYNPANGKKSLSNLAKCTPAKYPELSSDLVLTGAHSILVGDLTEKEREETMELMGKIYITDDKYRLVACLDDRADPYEDEGFFKVWHFALENEHYTRNYGVYANGLLVETASLRTMKEFSGMNLL